jgi:peptidoglycan/LPS O-acetylase OafA/YrhL
VSQLARSQEIDGLRALAVLPVILFHAGFQTFSGGFVGVDVFFVISGYLITSIILAELEEGNFSIATFYERRARRILPALFVVMLACLPFAWFWLPPYDMKNFSQSLVAVSVFASNIQFWRTSNYFETAAELKPLLHTWSLAVEEQYYFFFPIFLMLMWRLGRRFILLVLATLFVVSLALAQYLAVGKSPGAFYLLPTRGWEILVGAFVAFYVSSNAKIKIPKPANELIALVGFGLITYAILAFDKQTPFPSLYTLAPTIGAALIILSASQATWVGRLLGNKLLVGIGLISYSAYLWHQPLFAFARHGSTEQPGKPLLAALAALSMVLAYISWKYIETPFRDKSRINRRRIFQLGAAGSVLFIALGLAGHFSNGFKVRFHGELGEFLTQFAVTPPAAIPEEFRYACDFYDTSKIGSGNLSNLPKASLPAECYVRNAALSNSVFVWGDSHAQMLYPGLRRAMPTNWQILQLATSGCEPRLDAREDRNDLCEYFNWFAYSRIATTKPDVVVVAQNLHHDAGNMALISRSLIGLGVKKVIFTGPSPHWETPLPTLVFKLWGHVPRKMGQGLNPDVIELDKSLQQNFRQSDTSRYASMINHFCDAGACLVYIGDSIKDGITAYDGGHLMPIASLDFARKVLVPEILTAPGIASVVAARVDSKPQ